MITLLMACLFFEILVHMLNIASAKACAKTVFGHLKLISNYSVYYSRSADRNLCLFYQVFDAILSWIMILTKHKTALPWGNYGFYFYSVVKCKVTVTNNVNTKMQIPVVSINMANTVSWRRISIKKPSPYQNLYYFYILFLVN